MSFFFTASLEVFLVILRKELFHDFRLGYGIIFCALQLEEFKALLQIAKFTRSCFFFSTCAAAAVGKRDELGIALVLFPSLAATATECISICERLSDLLLSLIPSPFLPRFEIRSLAHAPIRGFLRFSARLHLFLNFSPLYFTYVMA